MEDKAEFRTVRFLLRLGQVDSIKSVALVTMLKKIGKRRSHNRGGIVLIRYSGIWSLRGVAWGALDA